MKLVTQKDPIHRTELHTMSERMFGGLVKAVVDLKKDIMVVDAAMHADEEKLLLDQGSNQQDLWGINLYPELSGDDFIEFDSMINIRPSQGNRSRTIENKEVRDQVIKLVNKLII